MNQRYLIFLLHNAILSVSLIYNRFRGKSIYFQNHVLVLILFIIQNNFLYIHWLRIILNLVFSNIFVYDNLALWRKIIVFLELSFCDWLIICFWGHMKWSCIFWKCFALLALFLICKNRFLVIIQNFIITL